MALALQAFLLHRLFKTPLSASFILLVSFMPYAFQHIVDFGTNIFQTTSVFLICCLAREWMRSLRDNRPRAWLYPFFIGLTVFFGIWIKLSFFALIPGVLALIFYSIFEKNEVSGSSIFPDRRKLILHFAILFVSAAAFTFMLLNSVDRGGQTYYQSVCRYAHYMTADPKGLLRYLFNPLLSADRIFIIEKGTGMAGGLLFIAALVFMLLSGIRQLYLKRIRFNYVILNIFLFFLTFFLVSMHSRSWAMHNVIVAFPFLILAMFYIYSKAAKSMTLLILLFLFVMLNLSFYYELSKLHYKEDAHPSLRKINKLLNDNYADRHVFVVIDWGMYYMQALYGNKNQCVLYLEPLNEEKQIKEVKRISADLNRKTLFIGRIDSVSDLSLINQNFSGLTELRTDFNTGKWRVWYEK
jgi:hypothetical protein